MFLPFLCHVYYEEGKNNVKTLKEKQTFDNLNLLKPQDSKLVKKLKTPHIFLTQRHLNGPYWLIMSTRYNDYFGITAAFLKLFLNLKHTHEFALKLSESTLLKLQ